jgi:hypothetical protein
MRLSLCRLLPDAVCGTLYLLAKNQGVVYKLRKEIEDHVKSEKE